MHRILLVLLLCFTGRMAVSQQLKNYQFSALNTHDGLTSNTVIGVRQDSVGYIWILDGNTLQRYDGHRFLTFSYEPGNPYSLPEGPIHNLSLDTRGRLWMMYQGFNVGYFDSKTFRFYKTKIDATKEYLHKVAGGVFTPSTGDVILVGSGKFVFFYDEKNREFSSKYNRFNFPDSAQPLTLLEDLQEHNFWACTHKGLYKYNVRSGKISSKANNIDNDPYVEAFGSYRTIVHFYIDRKKRGWMVNWPEDSGMAFYNFDLNTKKITEWQSKLAKRMNNAYWVIQGFVELNDGSFWVNGENILARLNSDGSDFDPLKKDMPGEYSIRYDHVFNIIEDREKNAWLATNTGLYRFNPSAQLINHIKNDRVFDDRDYPQDVTDIYQTRNGDILVSTWGEGVFNYDSLFQPSHDDHYYRAHQKSGEGLTWAILEHSNGDIWRAQQGGILLVWHPATRKLETIREPLFGGATIRQISEDSRGNLWFGSQGGRIIKWDYQTKKFSLQQRLLSIVPRMIIDSSDYLWACTEANGVFRIDTKDGSIVHRYVPSDTLGNGLRSSATADIIQYDDSIFVISAAGLNFLNIKTNKFTYLTQKNGLPAPDISNIMKDKRGYIWMTTEAALVSYFPPRKKISIYTADDGLNANYFNVATACIFKNGSIAFGTGHDVMLFDPNKLTISNYAVPTVTITDIKLSGQRLDLDSLMKLKTIELNYDQTSLSIYFSSLTYQNTYGIRYMMQDLEKKWLEAPSNREVIYNYLPPGDYTFKLASVNENGGIGTITEIYLHINPPFWKTWWFFTLLILAALGVLLLFDKQRIQRIRKEQQIRSSIAGNLHEEVNTVLQNISVLSEIARIKADAQPEQSKEYIYEIQQKSRNMVVAMNDVLWSINPVNDNMSKTLERISETAQALENKHGSKIIIQADDRVKDLNLSMRARHEFILIYKLAIVTLIEELKAPETTVQIDLQKSKLHLQLFALNVELPKNNNVVMKNINEIRTRGKLLNDGNVDIQSDEKGTWMMIEMKV